MKKIKILGKIFFLFVIVALVIPSNVQAAEIFKNNIEKNLALNKPVEGSPDIYIQPDNPSRYAVENAVDGDKDTLWGPVGNYPQSGNLIINLESEQKYNCIKFYGRTNDTVARTDKIVILASNDKSSWEEIASKSCTETNMILSFDDHVSQYVQIKMVPKEGKAIPAMAELEIYWNDPNAPQTLDTFTLSEYSYVDLDKTLTLDKNCIDDLGKVIPNEKVNFKFESSDPSIATVSNDGVVKGISKGKVTITATAESNGRSITVKKNIYSGYITPTPQGDKEEPSDAQLDMMTNRNYGLMMHFGINTFNNLQWSDGTIPVNTYNPDVIDADQWARVASEAGFTHIVAVSMHHDGFCMWDTKYTDYKCTNPESGNTTDVIKALSKACEKYGIKLGLYYSLWNRHESYYNDDLVYAEHMMNQLRELLGGEYGEISEIWLDGAWDKSAERWYLPELYDCIKSLQPNCQVGVNQTIGAKNGAITDPSNYKKYENIKYFPTDFKTWDGKTIADYDEPKIFTHDKENYYLPYEETVCVRNPFGGFSWFWDNSYNSGDLYPVESILQSREKLHSRGNVFLLNMGIDTGHMVEDDIATVYKAADLMNIAKGSAIGANELASEKEKAELRQLIDECRNIEDSIYTKASMRRLLDQVDRAEEKLDGDTDLRNADITAWKNLIIKEKDKLELIEGNANLALEKVIVEASPRPYDNNFVPENAIDGDDMTLWGPVDGANESYIVIDLGKQQKFNKICMDGRTSDTVTRADTYQILVGTQQDSDGKINFETVLNDVACTSAKQTIKFESVEARYVKIVINSKTDKVPAYKEISVYNNDTQQVINKVALKIAVEMADSVTEADLNKVVPAVVTEFKAALDEARVILANNNATQAQVDESFARLATAMHMLQFYKGDKTKLQGLVDSTADLVEGNYTQESWTSLQDALSEANTVLDDLNAMQEEVDEAYKNLQAKIDGLVKIEKVNKSFLEVIIDKVLRLQEDRYIPSTWQAMLPKLDKAQEVLGNEKATQEEVDNAYDALTRAYLGLRLKPSKDLLQDLINKANGLNSANYSADTWAVVADKVLNANAILSNPEATAEEVENAINGLTKAMAGLEANPTNPSVDNDVSPVKSGDSTVNATKTGDTTNMMYPLAGLAIAALWLYGNKKRRKEI